MIRRLGIKGVNDLPLAALLAWAPLSAVLYPFLRVGDPASLTFDRIWIAALGAWTLFNLRTGRPRSRPADIVAALAVLLVITFGIRSLLTPGDSLTVMKVWVDAIVLTVILFFAARRLITGMREMHLLVGSLAIAGLILAVIGLAEYAFDFELATRSGGTPFYDSAIDRVRVSGPFPLTETYALALLICFAATLCWHRLRGAGLLSLTTAIAVLELAAIGITFFRAAWIAALLVVGCALAYRLRGGMRTAVAVAIVAVLAAFAFGITRFDSVSTRLGNSDNVTGRVATWGQNLNVFATAPVFGVGVARFEDHTNRSTKVVISDVRSLNQPHSSYLGLLAEQGVVGFLPFLALTIAVWWMLRALRRSTDDDGDRAIWACLLGAGLAYLLLSLTLTMLPLGSSNALFALLLGGAAAQLDRLSPRREPAGDQPT